MLPPGPKGTKAKNQEEMRPQTGPKQVPKGSGKGPERSQKGTKRYQKVPFEVWNSVGVGLVVKLWTHEQMIQVQIPETDENWEEQRLVGKNKEWQVMKDEDGNNEWESTEGQRANQEDKS